MAGLSYSNASIVQAMLEGKTDLKLFLVLMIGMLIEVVEIYYLLCQLAEKEEIVLSQDAVAIRQAIFGIGRFKSYASADISQMRVDPTGRVEPYTSVNPNPIRDDGSELLEMGTGMIAFEYRGKTIRMGIGVNEAEAKELIAEIKRQYTQYGR